MTEEFVLFHGDLTEAYALCAAFDGNCACVRNGLGARVGPLCEVHTMAVHAQDVIDRLLALRRDAARLRKEEGIE